MWGRGRNSKEKINVNPFQIRRRLYLILTVNDKASTIRNFVANRREKEKKSSNNFSIWFAIDFLVNALPNTRKKKLHGKVGSENRKKSLFFLIYWRVEKNPNILRIAHSPLPWIPFYWGAVRGAFGFAVPSLEFFHKYKLICRYPSIEYKINKPTRWKEWDLCQSICNVELTISTTSTSASILKW